MRVDGRVVVLTAEIDELWRQGFGTIETAGQIRAVLAECWRESRLAVVNSKAELDELLAEKPDLVFSGINYIPGPCTSGSAGARLWIPEVAAAAGINCTGSTRAALELTLDKARTKTVLGRHGVPTAPFFVAAPALFKNAAELPVALPLFVKPLYEGDGRGIGPDSVVRSFNEYARKVQAIAAQWDQPAIAESYLEGREFTVARLGGGDEDPQLMPLELVPEAGEGGERILDFEAKKANRERIVPVPAGPLRQQLLSAARGAFKALMNRDYGRIDLRMDGSGRLYVLEANFIPGLMDRYSYLPLACEMYRGMSYRQTIAEIARVAAGRNC